MCGEGGILTTNNESVANAAKIFRQHGMTGPYQYAELGYNYRLTDLQAAIAVEQLKKVDDFTRARQANAEIFNKGLAKIEGLFVPSVFSDRSHVYHQYTLRIDSNFPCTREELMARLKEDGIGSGIYYPRALHTYPHISKLGYSEGDFPVAEDAAREVMSLPVHPRVSPSDAERIVTAVRKIANV